MRRLPVFALILLILTVNLASAQSLDEILARQGIRLPKPEKENINPSAVTVARLHYGGGGDWYWGSSAIPNLLHFIREQSNIPLDTNERVVQIMDDNLFSYPFLFATGHGTIKFTDDERERLRSYLAHGGFLFLNDSYGMETNLKREIAQLFPERELVELPFEHPIYRSYFDFGAGPPKIHEHDNKPPRGYGIIINGRVVLYMLIESDIGDGWEDPQVHNDPEEKRLEALKMGMNILVYSLTE
ncbi:MAG: DUF4159 domain-containing protein [Candidatus Zixiibacteriota bacterium]